MVLSLCRDYCIMQYAILLVPFALLVNVLLCYRNDRFSVC